MQLAGFAPRSTAPSSSPGWIGGALTYSGKGGTLRTWLRLDEVLGRPQGYDTVANARRAAARLTAGDDRPGAAVTQDGDGRYRVYAAYADAVGGVEHVPLAFERGLPRTPAGGMLDTWIFNPADGLVEVRDGTRLLLPYQG